MGEEMHGVVFLPDGAHDALIRKWWEELALEFDLAPVADTMVPHSSYHVATDYDLELVEKKLTSWAARTQPFKVKAFGLGLFAFEDAVVFYAALVRTMSLSVRHEELWQELAGTASNILEHYAPEVWVPHITLTPDGLKREQVPELAAFFAARPIEWEVEIDNVTLLHDTGQRQEVAYRVFLGSGEIVR